MRKWDKNKGNKKQSNNNNFINHPKVGHTFNNEKLKKEEDNVKIV